MSNKHLINQIKNHLNHTFSDNLFHKIYGSIVKGFFKNIDQNQQENHIKKELILWQKNDYSIT